MNNVASTEATDRLTMWQMWWLFASQFANSNNHCSNKVYCTQL